MNIYAYIHHIKINILSFLIYIYLTITELFKLSFNKNKFDSLTKSKIFNGNSKILNIKKFEFNELNYDITQKYVNQSIPFIIKNAPISLFNQLHEVYLKEQNELNLDPNINNKLIIKEYLYPKISDIKAFIKKVMNKNVIYMASFSGKYNSGFAHIDNFSSYNFYYVKYGKKDVHIIPSEFTKYVDMEYGIDNVYVKEDTANPISDTNNNWLKNIPAYYHFQLEENDVLIFNNSACIHKFSNLTGNEYIYTIRTTTDYSSPLILKNDIFNWKTSKHFSKIVIDKIYVRDTATI